MNPRFFYAILIAGLTLFNACIRISPFNVNKPASDTGPKSGAQIAFESKLKLFQTNESMAMEIYNLPDTTSKETLLYEIRDRGIYYWNENLKIVDEMETLDLPSGIEDRIPTLREYCRLRIKNYEFYYSICEKGERPAQHQQEIAKLDAEMNKVLAALK